MNIELNAQENALMISALTCKLEKLRGQRDLFAADGMPHWVADVEGEIEQVIALKDRLFK